MTRYEEWNHSDALCMELYFPNNPLSSAGEGLDTVLEIIERVSGVFKPDKVFGNRKYRYSRQRAQEQIQKGDPRFRRLQLFTEKDDGALDWSLGFGAVYGGLDLNITYGPLSFFRQPGTAQTRCDQAVHLVRALCQHLGPVDHGFVHSDTDKYLGSNPNITEFSLPPGAYEAYWLNVYGKSLVDFLGRQRVLSLPAYLVEPLPCGGVLWLSRPTLADFDSPEARLAQARCLTHLRPELRLEDVEQTLLKRSLAFQPIEPHFDPDISVLIHRFIEHSTNLVSRRKQIEHFNLYRPPPVSEWRPVQEVKPDVDNLASKVTFYEVQAESLIAVLHTKVPSVLDQEPASIIDVDEYVALERWADFAEHMPPAKRDRLVPMLGAYLGELVIKHLGGHWVPRRALLETAVAVGTRAWLPFLRAHHMLQVPSNFHGQSMDFTLCQFFHQAARLAGRESA
jgi:hypothetical protein